MPNDEKGVIADPPLLSRLAVWLATGLGVGLVTPAPGTIAGLWGLGLAGAVAQISPLGGQLAVILILTGLAVPVCQAAAKALGGEHDPGEIVLDEIVALPVVFVAVPEMNWTILLVGYVLFRICDIWKPGLARAAEDLPDGWGIVADDALAAVLACILLHGVIWLDGVAGIHWLSEPL